MRKPLVLLVGSLGEREEKIREHLRRCQIESRVIAPLYFDIPMGILAGEAALFEQMKAFKKSGPDGELAEPFMLLAHFEEEEFWDLLKSFREQGIETPMKAVLTETNQGWNPMELATELARERRELQKRQQEKKKE